MFSQNNILICNQNFEFFLYSKFSLIFFIYEKNYIGNVIKEYNIYIYNVYAILYNIVQPTINTTHCYEYNIFKIWPLIVFKHIVSFSMKLYDRFKVSGVEKQND